MLIEELLKLSEDKLLEDMIPDKLYHATYKPLLKSIMKKGLDGSARNKKNYPDSVHGIIYLAVSPHIAESYAETSDIVSESWLDQIVILEIDTSTLDKSKLSIDKNVQDNNGDTLEYSGIIHPSSFKVIQ